MFTFSDDFDPVGKELDSSSDSPSSESSFGSAESSADENQKATSTARRLFQTYKVKDPSIFETAKEYLKTYRFHARTPKPMIAEEVSVYRHVY